MSCAVGVPYYWSVRAFLDTREMECVSKCPEYAPVPNASHVCEPCQPDVPYFDDVKCNSCVEVYADTRPFWDPTARAYVRKCPSGLEPAESAKNAKTCRT